MLQFSKHFSERNTDSSVETVREMVNKNHNYRFLKMVGQGTFGKVYLAESREREIVAVKVIEKDPNQKQRELEIISQLKHYNVVKMKGYYEIAKAEKCYLNIVMEYIPKSLYDIIRYHRQNRLQLDPLLAKVYLFQLLKAFSYFKQRNLCHRDLKPSNILVYQDQHLLKVCDFGSSKILKPDEPNVSYICSRYYRPPELLLGKTNYSTEVDMWSVGCIAVQLIICEPVFPGQTTLDQLIEIIKIIGTPSPEYLKKTKSNLGVELELPNIKPVCWKKVLRKYKPDKNLVDLIERMLCYDTKARITPGQALLHPYFHDLTAEENKERVSQIPDLFNFDRNLFSEIIDKKKELLMIYDANNPSILSPQLKMEEQENKQNLVDSIYRKDSRNSIYSKNRSRERRVSRQQSRSHKFSNSQQS